MKKPVTDSYRQWFRGVFIVCLLGTGYVGLQMADLRAWQGFSAAEATPQTPPTRLAAYVPVAVDAGSSTGGQQAFPEVRIAEVGDGGELGQLAREALRRHMPVLTGTLRDDSVYVNLRDAVTILGGEFRAANDGTHTLVLPFGLVSLLPGETVAKRNFRPVSLPAPVLEGPSGELLAPISALRELCDITVEETVDSALYRLSRGEKAISVLVKERMYRIEISRGGRWLQLYFLDEPIKRYPICSGKGENTPVGNFHIQNKAVWPAWRAYWGEYMPGGSARNPLGARWLGTTARGRQEGRAIGIHGTNQPSSIGQRISGGCIRTYNHFAIELYNNIPVGTPVKIFE